MAQFSTRCIHLQNFGGAHGSSRHPEEAQSKTWATTEKGEASWGSSGSWKAWWSTWQKNTPGTEEHRMFMCKPMKPPPLNCPVSRPPPPTWFNSPLRRKMKAPPRNCPVAEVCVGPWICNLPFEICNLPEMKPDLAEICNPPVTSVPSTPQVTNWQQCQAEIVDWPVNSVPLTPQESKWQFEDASQSSQESCESVWKRAVNIVNFRRTRCIVNLWCNGLCFEGIPQEKFVGYHVACQFYSIFF